jgi:hypothetical protein
MYFAVAWFLWSFGGMTCPRNSPRGAGKDRGPSISQYTEHSFGSQGKKEGAGVSDQGTVSECRCIGAKRQCRSIGVSVCRSQGTVSEYRCVGARASPKTLDPGSAPGMTKGLCRGRLGILRYAVRLPLAQHRYSGCVCWFLLLLSRSHTPPLQNVEAESFRRSSAVGEGIPLPRWRDER